MGYPSVCGGFLRREQAVDKFAQLMAARHITAENQSAVFVNDKQRIGPNTVGAMNPAVEMIDHNWKPHIFQPFQVARVGEFLLEGFMRRIMFRWMRLASIKYE